MGLKNPFSNFCREINRRKQQNSPQASATATTAQTQQGSQRKINELPKQVGNLNASVGGSLAPVPIQPMSVQAPSQPVQPTGLPALSGSSNLQKSQAVQQVVGGQQVQQAVPGRANVSDLANRDE